MNIIKSKSIKATNFLVVNATSHADLTSASEWFTAQKSL